MSDDRLPRRGLFAILASIPMAVLGFLGRRRVEPALALPVPSAVHDKLAQQQYELLDLQHQMLHRQAERLDKV